MHEPLSVAIVPLPNFEMLTFASFVDAFCRAAASLRPPEARQIRWAVLAGSAATIPSDCGVGITPSAALGNPARYDCVAVIGAGPGEASTIEPATAAWLQRAAREGVTLFDLGNGRRFLPDGEQITSPGGAVAADIAAFVISRHCHRGHARLQHARWLLMTTNRGVLEIGKNCGFRDSPHFCRQFRKRFGISPLQARRIDRRPALGRTAAGQQAAAGGVAA
jgi:transcriptional regulator GlxA family with amidase domain